MDRTHRFIAALGTAFCGVVGRISLPRPRAFVAAASADFRYVLQTFRACRDWRYGYDVERIVAALLLLVAAILKAYQLCTEPVLANGFLDSRWFLIGVVEFELFFGLWLLSGLLPRLTWLAALACFCAFACVSLYKALYGYATCGCFGAVKVNPWYTTTLDLAVILSLLRWRAKGLSDLRFHELVVRTVCILLAWLLLGLPTAYAMASYANSTLSDAGDVIGNEKFVVLEPEKWIGKRFPLLGYIDIAERLEEGNWLLLLYHHDCLDCRGAIKNLSEVMLPCLEKIQVALIEVPPYGKMDEQPFSSQAAVTHGRLAESRDWFIVTPTRIVIKRAQVASAVVGIQLTPRIRPSRGELSLPTCVKPNRGQRGI